MCRVFETVDSARVPLIIIPACLLLSQGGFDSWSVKTEDHSAVNI